MDKDLDLGNLDTEMTIVPGLTATVDINESISAKFGNVIKEAPGYDSTLEEYGTDAQGNYRIDLLPDFTSTYTVRKDFDVTEHVDGLDDNIKTLSAVVTFVIENGVEIGFNATIVNDGGASETHAIPAKQTTCFNIVYNNLMDLDQIEASLSTSYAKGSNVSLNKNDQINVTVTQAVISIPDGITINF